MGLVLSLGGGILGGLAIMIWALAERSKRHKAETDFIFMEVKKKDADKEIERIKKLVTGMEDEKKRLEEQILFLRNQVDKFRDRLLVECENDPETIQDIFDQEFAEKIQ